MSDDVVGLIQAIVDDRLKTFRTTDLGVVTAVYPHESGSDKNNYECDVRLRDSGAELKRLAIATHRIGEVAVPNTDDLVIIQHLNGDINTAVVTGRVYNDKDRPPQSKVGESVYVSPDSAASGVRRAYLEWPNSNTLLVDDDKAELKMGQTTITIKHDGDVEVAASGQVTVKGKSKVVVDAPQIELVDSASHALVLGDELLNYLTQLTTMFQSHTHPGQMAGPIPVSPAPPVPPLPTPTPSLLSMKVKTG